MSGLGEHFPEFQKGADAAVTPVDIDRYEVYSIIGPMMGTFSLGTVVGTQTQAKTLVFDHVLADYPRNVEVKILPAIVSVAGGTFVLSGKNQFGEVISETFSIASAANGGTAVGTKVFANFTAGTGTMGTGDAGNGTVTVYPASTGTTALFGLPTKVAGSTDLKMLTMGSTGVAKAVNGGTIGAFIDTTVHAIKAPNTITTPAANTTWIQALYRTTWRNTNKANMAAL